METAPARPAGAAAPGPPTNCATQGEPRFAIPGFSRKARLAFAMGAAALAVVFLAWTRLGWGGETATRTFVDVSTTLVAGATGLIAIAKSRYVAAERRRAWAFGGAAMLAWAVGNFAWSYYELIQQQEVPFPSAADAGYLLLLPLGAAALLALIVGGPAATSRLRTSLDGLIIVSAMLFVAYALFLRSIGEYALQQDGILAKVVAFAYPTGDVFLLSLMVLVLPRVQATSRKSLAWISAGLLAFTVADVGFWYFTAEGTYQSGSITDIGWLLGFLLLAFAAMRPSNPPASATLNAPGALLSVVPLVPFFVGLGFAVGVTIQGLSFDNFQVWLSLFVVVTLAARQFVIVRENLGLRRNVEKALDALRAQEAIRTRLMHAIAHDLRNPLTPILAQLKIASIMGPLADGQRKALDSARSSLEQVRVLVQDLSTLARIEDGRLELKPPDVDVGAIASNAVESFRPLAADRGLSLSLEQDPAVHAQADPTRVGQVLFNLLSNALKFTPKGGKIRVRTRMDGPRTLLEVEDSGRGLTSDEVRKLFQPFSQVHNSDEVEEKGTGLGLYISRALAEAQGGSLAVSSPGRGLGAVFTLQLPRLDGGAPWSPTSGRRLASGVAFATLPPPGPR